jgi:hypothetical protein
MRFQKTYLPLRRTILKRAPGNAVRLLQSREDIDFIQNTYDSSVLSLIHPFRTNLRSVAYIPSGSADFVWSHFLNSENAQSSFYVGIPIELKNINKNNAKSFEDQFHGISTLTCILYDINSIITFPVGQVRKKIITDNYSSSKITAFFDNVYLDLSELLDRIERVQALLKGQPEKYAPPKKEQYIKPNLDQGPCNEDLDCLMKKGSSTPPRYFPYGSYAPSWRPALQIIAGAHRMHLSALPSF